MAKNHEISVYFSTNTILSLCVLSFIDMFENATIFKMTKENQAHGEIIQDEPSVMVCKTQTYAYSFLKFLDSFAG